MSGLAKALQQGDTLQKLVDSHGAGVTRQYLVLCLSLSCCQSAPSEEW